MGELLAPWRVGTNNLGQVDSTIASHKILAPAPSPGEVDIWQRVRRNQGLGFPLHAIVAFLNKFDFDVWV